MTASAQSAAHIVMIRPANFASNPETIASNRFQASSGDLGAAEIQQAARAEFDALATALTKAGVNVHVFDDTTSPIKPDALFPNNWFSTHPDGTVVLYPMLAPNRRLERRDDLIEALHKQASFHVHATVDLTHREIEGKYLEGTGSLVLDRVNRIAYACLSPRTDLDVLGEFGAIYGILKLKVIIRSEAIEIIEAVFFLRHQLQVSLAAGTGHLVSQFEVEENSPNEESQELKQS